MSGNTERSLGPTAGWLSRLSAFVCTQCGQTASTMIVLDREHRLCPTCNANR